MASSKLGALRDLVVQTRRRSGHEFLAALAEGLSRLFGGGFAEIGLVEGGFIKAPWCAFEGRRVDPISYPLSGTPCAEVIAGKTKYQRHGLMASYPEDAVLRDRDLDSYVGAPMFDAGGEPLGLIAVATRVPLDLGEPELALIEALAARSAADVERDRALRRWAATQADFAEMVDLQEEMVCRFSPDGAITFANRAYREILGTHGDGGKRHIVPAIHPDDRERVRAELAAVTPDAPRRTIVNRVLAADGSVRWTRWTNRGLFDETGSLVGYQAAGRDITAEKEAHAALERQQEQLRFLAEVSSVLSSSLELEDVLQRAARLLVPALADSSSIVLFREGTLRILREHHVDPEIERRLNERTSLPRGAAVEELRRRLVAGESILVSDCTQEEIDAFELDAEAAERVRLRNVRSYLVVPLVARGHTLGALTLTTSRAHSNRRYAQEDLHIARLIGLRAGMAIDNARLFQAVRQSAQQKDQFLAMLAHELRNPIAAVINALTVLEMPVAEDKRARALAIARRQALQQAKLIDDLLDVSRLTRGKVALRPETLDLVQAVRQVVDAKRGEARARKQSLSVDAPSTPVPVRADPARLEQIVANLLDNACKYTDTGGSIRVEMALEENEAVLRVSDTGVGIEPEMLDRIFDMFSQAPRECAASSGLGIGLTVVRELVKLHGGSVVAASEGPGLGSRFEVRLPALEALHGEAQRTAEQPAPAPAHGRSRRILIVEDNADAAEALHALLSAWGHEVRAVHGGEAALELALAFAPELALVDLAMPGIDGFTTARRLRAQERGRDMVLVALTGFGQPADVRRALEAEFDRHVTKPARPEILRELIAELDGDSG